MGKSIVSIAKGTDVEKMVEEVLDVDDDGAVLLVVRRPVRREAHVRERRHHLLDPLADRLPAVQLLRDTEDRERDERTEEAVEQHRHDGPAYTEAKFEFTWRTVSKADRWAQETGWQLGPSDG